MIGLQEFQVRARIGDETLRAWVEASWLIPRLEEPEPSFSEADVARARLIRDLTGDLGVNEDGVGVILDLLDQIHGLRRTLGDLVQAVRVQPEAVQREIAAAMGGAAGARRDA
jgi:chaperone modulatory protein CbpM